MAKRKQGLDKFAVAAALQEIAALLELKGGTDRFKARAYQTGARVIAAMREDLGDVIKAQSLTSMRGIGNALASQIEQLYLTGESSVLRGLRKDFPPGIVELSGVPGLSINKIKTLHDALGITTVAQLKRAAEAGRISEIKGFGPKSEQRLLETLSEKRSSEKRERRLHIHHAERIADPITDYLRMGAGVSEVVIAGSLRRRKETVGVIRLVAAAKKPSAVIKHFLNFPLIIQVVSQSDGTCEVVLAEGAKVSVAAVKPDDFPLALITETGSQAHVTKLLSLKNRKSRRTTAATTLSPIEKKEAVVYQRLGMQFIPAELREDLGEIETATSGKLPEDLITSSDIQGMVHCHTTYSDGKHSVEAMAMAAESMGMKYITITDHSPTAFYAGGVTLDQLKKQWDEIAEVQEKVNVKILRGTESDIVASGHLDYPDEILEQFDVIVASIHSRYKMDSEKMTKRIVTAMRQPVFKIWGHALGRLIERRPPFECDVEKILDVIAESRAAIEINGDPFRLDMEPRWIREARKRKIKFVISVDAHSAGALNNVKYGVGIARRGWVRKGEVLNSLNTKAFAKAVRPA